MTDPGQEPTNPQQPGAASPGYAGQPDQPDSTTLYNAADRTRLEGLGELADIVRALDSAVTDWKDGANLAETLTGVDLPEEPLPEQIGRYRIVKRLGAGGMGVVYQAHDPQLDRIVAIKVPFFEGPRPVRLLGMQRFLREARVAGRIRHPNICPIYDVGEHEGTPYTVMAFIEGPTLAQLLKQGNLPLHWAVELTRKVALALEALHQVGIIHRDVKPGNILLDPSGEPLLTDFGLARPMVDAERLTREGAVLGTPGFMAPEQATGENELIGPWTDVYSLGVVLYRLLSGRMPFEGPALKVLYQSVHELPPLPSQFGKGNVNREIDSVVLKALAPQSENRYRTAQDFAAALEGWLVLFPEVTAEPDSSRTSTQENLQRDGGNKPEGEPAAAVLSGLPGGQGVRIPIRPRTATSVRDSLSKEGQGRKSSKSRRRLTIRVSVAVFLILIVMSPMLLFRWLLSPADQALQNEKSATSTDKREKLSDKSIEKPSEKPIIKPVQEDPVVAESKIHFKEGITAFEKKEWDRALQLFSAVLTAKKDHVDALFYRGRTHLQKHNNLKAIADLDGAIKLNPKHALAYAYRGLAHIEQGLFTDDATKYAQGIADCNRALEFDPKLAAAYAFRGFGYLPTDYKQAIRDCNEALKLDNKLALAYAIRGRAQFFPRQYDLGMEDCLRALRIDPQLAKAYLYRGYLQYQKQFDRGELSYLQYQKQFDRGELTTKSLVDFNKAIALDPNYAIVYVDRGNWYYRAKQLDLALRDYETALSLQPDYIFALNGRGNIHDARKNYPQAIADYTAAIKLDQNPYTCVFYTNRGNTYTRPGFQDWDKAEADFKKAIKVHPTYPQNYVGLALFYENRKEVDKAIKYYQEAIKLNPKEAGFQVYLGWAFHRKGDQLRAEAAFANALEYDKKNPGAYQGLAQICFDNQEYDTAIRHSTKALESEPSPLNYRLRGDFYLKKKPPDYLRALADYTAAFRLDPTNPIEQNQLIADLNLILQANVSFAPAYILRSRVNAQKKFFDAALQDAEQAVKLSPKDPAAWNARGWVRLLQGELDKALDDFNAALAKSEFGEAYRHRGTVYSRQKKYKQAIIDFGKAIALNEKDHLAYNGRGLVHFEKGELDEAENDFTKALELNKDFAEGYYNRGKTYAARKLFASAVEEYTQALVCDPTVAAVYRDRAQALRQLDEGDMAKADEETARKLEAK
jgi:tetratricopeptide (TPR) repeat protein